MSVDQLVERAKSWLLVLDERLPADRLPEVVAHEIAHAYLNHRGGLGAVDEPDDQEPADEAAAERLAAEWGFPSK